jgi:hypothetical protein
MSSSEKEIEAKRKPGKCGVRREDLFDRHDSLYLGRYAHAESRAIEEIPVFAEDVAIELSRGRARVILAGNMHLGLCLFPICLNKQRKPRPADRGNGAGPRAHFFESQY